MSTNPLDSATRWPWLSGVAALALLAVMIASSPSHPVYDEAFHLDLAKSVLASGWRAALTSPHNESAAGPLYPAIHIAAWPLTKFQAPAIRWVSIFCLGIMIGVQARTNRRELSCPDWISAISILSVPYLWPTAGMALTELPALAAFTLFVFALLQVLRMPVDKALLCPFGWSVVAGLALGLSILGRQTYLVILPVVGALFFAAPRKWLLWVVCITVALGSCSWLFVLWHGLVPQPLRHADSGFRLDYGALSLSYVAAATLFLNPQWLKIRNGKVAILAVVFGVGLAVLTRDYANPPAKSLLLKVLGERLGLLAGFSIGIVLTGIAVIWVVNSLLMAWRERGDPVRAFLFLSLFVLVAAPMKVFHQFSSRYVVGVLGILILVVGVPQTPVYWLALRIAVGGLAGAATLWTYYQT